jgi:hypothetical protein
MDTNDDPRDIVRPEPSPFETDKRQPVEEFPRFDDPAASSRPAQPAVSSPAPVSEPPPDDTRHTGHPDFSQDAALESPPENMGNAESVDDVDEQTRHSDGQNPPRSDHFSQEYRRDVRITQSESEPNPATQQVSGAGPAIAERSKDARATVPNRQPGAYVEDESSDEAEGGPAT